MNESNTLYRVVLRYTNRMRPLLEMIQAMICAKNDILEQKLY